MWETVIGLEVHVQLKTCSKLFSSARLSFGATPNSQANYIDAGLPGVLPMLNQQALHLAIKFGIAIEAEINDLSFFERKHYFYPDLPKGYQITQNQRPIVGRGHLLITTNTGIQKRIIIESAHLEEDAGKLIHNTQLGYTGIDLNRAGAALLEIVTTPSLSSADETVCFLKTLQQLLRFLDISDANMQEGAFRCDVNISLRKKGMLTLGTRIELKNMNSYRFIEKAIEYEVNRQQQLLANNTSVLQQTRAYCTNTNTTYALRRKENATDYRYMPDPDLLPIKLLQNDIDVITQTMPPQPSVIKKQLYHDKRLLEDDINFLLSSPFIWRLYESIKQQSHATTKIILNWLKGPYCAILNDQNLTFEHQPLTVESHSLLINAINDKQISASIAKRITEQTLVKIAPSPLITTATVVTELINKEVALQIINDSNLKTHIQKIIAQHPKHVEEYRAGKEKLLGFFIGLVMKDVSGNANPADIGELLKKYLIK